MRFYLLQLPALCIAFAARAAQPLPALAASTENLTVSGISSGAYMAVQMSVAHSSLIRGVGVIAGGPYDCSAGSVSRALKNCMSPTAADPPPGVDEQRQRLAESALAGKIDATGNLQKQRVWLFSGANDQTVAPQVMDALAGFYKTAVPASSLRYVKHAEAGHAMISSFDRKANACASSRPPYINQCAGLDAPGALLEHLLGPLRPAVSLPTGALVEFDQRPFFNGKAMDASLSDEGFVYIPDACRQGNCRVHVAFHGCQQNASEIGRRFVEGAGYNAWADSNRLIVLYPQTAARHGLAVKSWKWLYNPKGCWDWWGYTGAEYAGKNGIQIRGIKAMLDHLFQPLTP